MVADGGPTPDRHVAPLVVAVARLRPDVRAGQRHVPIRRDGEARGRRERRDAAGRIDRRLDGDRHRIARLIDPGRDVERIGRQLLEAGLRVDLRGRAHHAASFPSSTTSGSTDVSPSRQ